MSITEDDLAVDRELAEISGMLPFLRYTTPINTADQYRRFIEEGSEPEFEYLPLPDLREVIKRLEDVEPDRAMDPMIAHIALIKKRELEMVFGLLQARNTGEFFLGAVEFFGHVEGELVETASLILQAPTTPSGPRESIDSHQFATAAGVEIDYYRSIHPELTARVFVSGTATGIRVENGNLYIGTDVRVPVARVEALLQHEVGVHVLTYANGAAQPLKLLAAGLPGYEENQEALGVLAEYLTGGLEPGRLRVLALRVMASHLRSNQSSFVETVGELIRLGASRTVAFTTAMRSHRSGGMTRDASYLRGFARLLEHIAAGGQVEHLLVGKVRLEDEPLISDLLERQVLSQPPLTPRFMENPEGQQLLAGLRNGTNLLEIGQT